MNAEPDQPSTSRFIKAQEALRGVQELAQENEALHEENDRLRRSLEVASKGMLELNKKLKKAEKRNQ